MWSVCCGVFPLSQKTTGIVNVSEEPNWCSLMCRCGCSVLSVSCHPSAKGSLKEAGTNQAVKFSTGTTVWQQLNYYDTSHNQRGCRDYRHLFSTGGQGTAVNAQYSIQVTAITPNVWVIWPIRGGLRGKDCRQLCDITVFAHNNVTQMSFIENWSNTKGCNLLARQTCITSTPDQKKQNNNTTSMSLQPHCISYSVINSLNIELNNDTKPGLLTPTA